MQQWPWDRDGDVAIAMGQPYRAVLLDLPTDAISNWDGNVFGTCEEFQNGCVTGAIHSNAWDIRC